MPLLLEGNVDNRDLLIQSLQDEVRSLRYELSLTESRLLEAKTSGSKAVDSIRRQLSPLYQALQSLFGDMDSIGESSSPKANAVWESWKKKLGGYPAEFIQAFLDHGQMSIPQLRVAAKCGQQTAYDVTSKLFKLGLISKNGGKYWLKEL